MFSYLIVALFALLSLVSSRPLGCAHSSISCDLPTANATLTPSYVHSTPPSSPSPSPTTDDCSEPTTVSPVSTYTTPIPTYTTPLPPTTTPVPPTSAAPTTSVVSTTATSSTPASTAAVLTTVSGGPFTGGVATYFYQNGNAGACGQVNSDSAFICAMDQTRFGTNGPSSSLCGQQVKITNDNTGASITVTIADDCPTCENENSIDLSVGAFEALASLSEGVFPITWSYV